MPGNNPSGPSNIGVGQWDPRWKNYGEYLQRLVDTVQAEWDTLLDQSDSVAASGTHATVTFRLNSDGNIVRIVKVEGNAGDLGQKCCISAITNREPYGNSSISFLAPGLSQIACPIS